MLSHDAPKSVVEVPFADCHGANINVRSAAFAVVRGDETNSHNRPARDIRPDAANDKLWQQADEQLGAANSHKGPKVIT
jgi:hypothetical protein